MKSLYLFFLRPAAGALLGLFVLGGLNGCAQDRLDKIDPAGNLSRADYRSLRDRPAAAEYQAALRAPDGGPPIPEMVSALPAPALPDAGDYGGYAAGSGGESLVSISVTDAVPLRDVLIELARKARVNLELDPRVQGGVIFSAYSQPLGKVMERLAALGNLRYTLRDNTLQVYPDEPYSQDYRVDYLNLARKSESEVAIATNVFDADVAGNSGSGNTRGSGAQDGNNSPPRCGRWRKPISGARLRKTSAASWPPAAKTKPAASASTVRLASSPFMPRSASSARWPVSCSGRSTWRARKS